MRIWIDTTTMALMDEERAQRVAQAAIDEGNFLVMANTACDVKLFQNQTDWFEEMLEQHKIIIEIWATPDQMVSKPFYWSSAGVQTAAAASLEEAVCDLHNATSIIDVAKLVEYYGIPRGAWACGTYAPPTPLNQLIADKLGVPVTATRTEVLAAAKANNLLTEYDEYNVAYNTALARQHYCDAILTTTGYQKI